jgi:hypothetical protein
MRRAVFRMLIVIVLSASMVCGGVLDPRVPGGPVAVAYDGLSAACALIRPSARGWPDRLRGAVLSPLIFHGVITRNIRTIRPNGARRLLLK